jgi:hypothetical protein
MDLIDFMDFAPICRDDRCELEHVHRVHTVRGRERVFHHRSERPDPWRAPDCTGLRIAVFDAIELRRCKPLREIKQDVFASFGATTGRSVQRAIVDLLDDRQIIHVVAPEQARHRGAHGAYIRMDSPLLWEPDGYAMLLDQLYDCATRRGSDTIAHG